MRFNNRDLVLSGSKTFKDADLGHDLLTKWAKDKTKNARTRLTDDIYSEMSETERRVLSIYYEQMLPNVDELAASMGLDRLVFYRLVHNARITLAKEFTRRRKGA